MSQGLEQFDRQTVRAVKWALSRQNTVIYLSARQDNAEIKVLNI
jgi:hypothetical protein